MTTNSAGITSPAPMADGGKGGVQPPEPAWLTRYRTRAIENAGTIRNHDYAANLAHGWAMGTILTALRELARPEPDIERVRDYLMDGYASSEAIMGKLDTALDRLVEIDAVRKRKILHREQTRERLSAKGPVTL